MPLLRLLGYLLSAAFLSFTLAALVGYPSAAINSNPGSAPNDALWGVITVVLGLALTAYSATNKPRRLLKLNWLVLPILSTVFFLFCRLFNPESIDKNAGMILHYAIYTFGLPFWLPLLALVLHMASCACIDEES